MLKKKSRKHASIAKVLGSNMPIKGRNVRIGSNVLFGDNVVIYDNVTIEHDTVIGANVIIGEPTANAYGSSDYRNPPTKIGHDSIVRSGTVIYAGCKLGPRLTTGHYAAIRENTVCGERCSFGTFSTSDGDVTIGNNCRFHYYTHVCKWAKLGNDIRMFPKSMLLNDPHPPCARCRKGPTISDRVIIGSAATISPKITVGEDAVIAAASMVTRDVPPGMLVMGVPAKVICRVSDVECKTGLNDQPYPWKDKKPVKR